MRACPQCGQDVAFGHERCTSCGAELRPERPVRGYVLSAVALIAIILAAVLLHSYLWQRVVRPPTDFVPSSAVAAINVDLRPGSPAMLLLREKWASDDIDHLGRRATQLAQDSVSLLGLDLDLREDVSRWFGGEVTIASVPDLKSPPLSARSLVLIVRATDLRQARDDVADAVAELAHEHKWDRFSRRSDGRAIVFWGRARDHSEIAYTVSDGCVVMGASADVVDLCLQAARASAERLTDTAEFGETRGHLPASAGNAFLWCYSRTGVLLEATSILVPSVREGWLGFIEAYFRSDEADAAPRSAPSTPGSFAFALVPEGDGLSAYASHWRGSMEPVELPESETPSLIKYVPREAVGYAFIRDARGLVSSLVPFGEVLPARQPFFLPWSLGLLSPSESIPESVLVAVLPGDSSPRVGFVMTSERVPETDEVTAPFSPRMPSDRTDDAYLAATDSESLRRLRQAGADPGDRLAVELEPDVYVQLWARPGALTPRLTGVEEIELALRGGARGGTARLRVRAEPSRLLGN